MSDIKSTLDLVMERTRHLTLSDEERREQQRRERQDKLQGLIRKYQDLSINGEQFTREWTALLEGDGSHDDGFLAREIAARCDPDRENRRWLELLAGLYGMDIGGLRAIMHAYRDTLGALAREKRLLLSSQLSEKGVSGSAVVPNLETDGAWTAGFQTIRSEFTDALAQEILRCSAAGQGEEN